MDLSCKNYLPTLDGPEDMTFTKTEKKVGEENFKIFGKSLWLFFSVDHKLELELLPSNWIF